MWLRAVILGLALLLSACKEERPVVSVEQARQITADFKADSFVLPPRSVSDVAALLEQVKPDAAANEAVIKAAEAQPTADMTGPVLAQFYFDRAAAAGQIGRLGQAIEDYNLSLAAGAPVRSSRLRVRADLGRDLVTAGRMREARAMYLAILSEIGSENRGFSLLTYRLLSTLELSVGDVEAAAVWVDEAESLLSEARSWKSWDQKGPLFTSNVKGARANVTQAQGRLVEAEALYREDLALGAEARAAADRIRVSDPYVGSDVVLLTAIDTSHQQLAVVLQRLGRTAEAEFEARTALTSQLRLRGGAAPEVARAAVRLASILAEQGRFADAERLTRAAIRIYDAAGLVPGSFTRLTAVETLAMMQAAQQDWTAAKASFAEIAAGVGMDAEARRRFLDANPVLGVVELKTGAAASAVARLEAAYQLRLKRFGEKDGDTAMVRGFLGAARAALGDDKRALEDFQAAVPLLMNQAGDETSGQSSFERHRRFVLEAYLALLARLNGPIVTASGGPVDRTEETFKVAEAARGQKVQQALAEASARGAIADTGLAEFVRRSQDSRLQISALQTLLSDALSLPADQQVPATLDKIRRRIEELRGAVASLNQEIARKFPDYARLVDPPAAGIADAQANLHAGEALLVTYVAERSSYVWFVPAQGPARFAQVPITRAQVAADVDGLRRALDPKASTLGDIPAFDVATANRLYAQFVASVTPELSGVRTLFVVPSGPLGQLPFGVLVTKPVGTVQDRGALFSGYRDVPFLSRSVAVSQLPGVSSLVSLRGTRQVQRPSQPFIGFGDPWFSKEQATQVAAVEDSAPVTRGLKLRSAPAVSGVASANLALLPRLPDTAEEVRSIATVLKADLSKDVFLGVAANEQTVETTDLSNRRVVVFATHGLVPGDLDGLTEPALALTAPQIAGISGTGLLTMTKILRLKLNADWVVLSACNTASGEGAGAEAVSGLGRAFFYAGARSVMVSNWPVETRSARMLTTDVFRRQAADPTVTRAEALRQASLALIDTDGPVTPDGKIGFSYAHPIFWAPFSLVGDGS